MPRKSSQNLWRKTAVLIFVSIGLWITFMLLYSKQRWWVIVCLDYQKILSKRFCHYTLHLQSHYLSFLISCAFVRTTTKLREHRRIPLFPFFITGAACFFLILFYFILLVTNVVGEGLLFLYNNAQSPNVYPRTSQVVSSSALSLSSTCGVLVAQLSWLLSPAHAQQGWIPGRLHGIPGRALCCTSHGCTTRLLSTLLRSRPNSYRVRQKQNGCRGRLFAFAQKMLFQPRTRCLRILSNAIIIIMHHSFG